MLSTLLFRLRRVESKLPLSIVVLLLGAVAAVSFVAYREVVRATVESTNQRLGIVSSQLAASLEESLAERVVETQAAADHPAVRAALDDAASSAVESEARAVLEGLRDNQEPILAVGLWDADGRLRIESRRADAEGRSERWRGTEPPARGDSAGLGSLQRDERLLWYDAVGVVREGDRAIGYVVLSRQVSSPLSERRQLTDLVGMDAAFVVGQPGGLWTDLDRVVEEPAPVAEGRLGAVQYATADRGSRFAFGRAIGDTGWQIWVESPRAVVLRGPRAFLRRVSWFGIAIALLGVLVGWGLSRGFTERLERLRVAANAVAEGRYQVSVQVEGDDELGELARAFDTMAARIAESHRSLEEQVDDRTAELRASEAQYRALASTANAAIVTANARGEITYFNPAAEALFGWSVGEAVGRPLRILMPDRLHAAHDAGFSRHLAGGEPRWIGRTVEVVAARRDGTELPVELSLASWCQDGELAFCGILQDISARKEDEAALVRYAADLELANRELEAFTYSASHDLRAPLRAIQGFGGFLLEQAGDRLDERSLGYLRRMCAAADRMRHLIDALLELSRAGRQELVLAEVDLTGLARQIAAELEGGSPGREVEWRIDDGLMALGDRQLVGVVLRNLLGNAWKFTARNRERALIEVASWTNEPDTFLVRDNGAGFDMELAGQIFGPFRRLHAESEFSGTGIGLSIVRRVVERHRGKVWAEGAVGAGATFYFSLPRDAGPAA